MSEIRIQFSLTRAALSEGWRIRKQFPIDIRITMDSLKGAELMQDGNRVWLMNDWCGEGLLRNEVKR
jgi:hypothetical protein